MKVLQLACDKNVIWFLVSQGITLFGSQIVQMAIVWYVTMNTAKGVWVAAISIAAYLPQFAVSFAGGILADRFSRKTLIILADMLIALITFLFLICGSDIANEFSLLKNLVALSTVRSAAAGVQNPAVNAAIADMIPDNDNMRYNGLNAAIQALVQFVSPAVAVVALYSGSLRFIFAIDVITALIGISILSCLRISDAACMRNSEPVWDDMLCGIRYVLNTKEISNTISIYSHFLWWSIPGGYLAGLYVSRTYVDSYWSLSMVELVGFGGMLLGGIMLSHTKVCINRIRMVKLGLMVFGIMSIAMSVCRVFELYLACMLLYGIALTVIQTTITTILQELSLPDMRGRVFGLLSSVYASVYPVGMAVFGSLSDMIPLSLLMSMSGMALVLCSILVHRRYND